MLPTECWCAVPTDSAELDNIRQTREDERAYLFFSGREGRKKAMGLSQLLRDRRVRIPAALRSLCACMIYMAGVGNERKRGLASVLWYIVTVLCGQCTSATSSEHFGVERSGFFGVVTFCVLEDDSLRARRLRVNFPIAVVDGAMKLLPCSLSRVSLGVHPSIHSTFPALLRNTNPTRGNVNGKTSPGPRRFAKANMSRGSRRRRRTCLKSLIES